MKRYDERVLHLLLDRYENSLLYEGKNKVNVSIFIPVNKRTLPEYFDVTSTEYDTIQEQLLELESQGYLTLVWGKQKKHILEKCILNTMFAEEIYRMLHRIPKKEKEEQFLALCRELQEQYPSPICSRFLKWVTVRVEAGEHIKEYTMVEDEKSFVKLLALLSAIENNTEELFLRQLSIKVFHDSKVAEAEIRKAAHILLCFREERKESYIGDDVLPDDSAEQILAEYHIFRNPSWVMMKGTGRFTIASNEEKNSDMVLRHFPSGIGISNEDIGKIIWKEEDRPEYVITIENLTSFHQWKVEDKGLCIYLGGYANEPRRRMLRQLYEQFEGIPFYHFGDIDCGGFLIWKNLCEATGIPISLKGMDLAAYEKYKEFGRDLTVHDRKRFMQMKEDRFFDEQVLLFEHILAEGKKLEQECVTETCLFTK